MLHSTEGDIKVNCPFDHFNHMIPYPNEQELILEKNGCEHLVLELQA
jgi:hypothetical protein